MRGEGIPQDAAITWRHTQQSKAIFFVLQPIADPDICRMDLQCVRLKFVSTFLVAVTETTLRQRLEHEGIQTLNGEGLQVLFHYILEEASCLEGTEADQQRIAARTFMLSIQAKYPTLYPSLAHQYSMAVVQLYPRDARDIPRWAQQGVCQLDAVQQAVNMICVLNATDANLFRPPPSRDEQRFSTIQAMTVVPEPQKGGQRTSTTTTAARGSAPARSPTTDQGSTPAGVDGHYGPANLRRVPRHLRPPFPAVELLRPAHPGEQVCESCNIPGHSPDKCRIFDAETMRENGGRKALFWFDIVKEPRDYQDRLIAYLKSHGALREHTPAELEYIDRRLEETREWLDKEHAERTANPEGYNQRNGLGYRGRTNGRGGGRGGNRGRPN